MGNTMTNKEYLENWKATRVLTTVTFYWYDKSGEAECRLHQRTFNEALEVAKSLGFKEPKWYNPWTWRNMFVTVG
jgi:uncharacterized protein YcfL